MNTQYLDLMEQTLSAYSVQHVDEYFRRVQLDGLTEHGFARLTANIGILIANGRRPDLLDRFLAMMDFCCETMPVVKAANDFTVKEIIFSILALEAAGNAVPQERLAKWRQDFSTIQPEQCYTCIAHSPEDKVYNWAAFTCVSEWMRAFSGNSAVDMDFIDTQIASQLQWLDENGMYQDPNNPMVYDLVPRGLFAMLLHFGYRGKYFAVLDDCLRKTGLMTLKMQSVTGEIAYGGRSNQFMHNESQLAILFEYEARRYSGEGDFALAGLFKLRAKMAKDSIAGYLAMTPIRHVKNRFSTESGYGCETYAYFDKYMITTASFLYAASLVCDDSIAPACGDSMNFYTWQTSEAFHKVFLRNRGWFAQIDSCADPHYDASGLGRIHRRGAPSAICLSVPCTATPNYQIDVDDAMDLAIASGIRRDGKWCFATGAEVKNTVISHGTSGDAVYAVMESRWPDGSRTEMNCRLKADRMEIFLRGEGDLALLVPVLDFDGEVQPEQLVSEKNLEICYRGWCCHYSTPDRFADMKRIACNRNGHYRVFAAEGKKALALKIMIYPERAV
ncbi:MAG: hypothetical protein J6S73_07550 [Lentisphaeria bacterium]|nr:hypothetical protein [Lentisphaeria bacterium]